MRSCAVPSAAGVAAVLQPGRQRASSCDRHRCAPAASMSGSSSSSAGGNVNRPTKSALDQIQRIGPMQVFRHALAVGDVVQRQPVADQHIERTAQHQRLVHLGENAACQLGAAVGARHIFQHARLRNRGEQQQAPAPGFRRPRAAQPGRRACGRAGSCRPCRSARGGACAARPASRADRLRPGSRTPARPGSCRRCAAGRLRRCDRCRW